MVRVASSIRRRIDILEQLRHRQLLPDAGEFDPRRAGEIVQHPVAIGAGVTAIWRFSFSTSFRLVGVNRPAEGVAFP